MAGLCEGDNEPSGSLKAFLIINHLLTYNEVRIQDGKTTSAPIVQTNGILQGDPISTLLFNLVTTDITSIIQNPAVVMYLYADGIVISWRNRGELQAIMDRLEEYAEDNSLTVNTSKTVKIVFRRGGKIAAGDKIIYKGEELKVVNSFNYLGITLQTTVTSFRNHIEINSSHQEYIRH
ncbi:hypothetical protein ANN_08593 [Periplaneta americana]|uniref:Reverse transcriptase domain-containing protein n=1 Tax=Periplaneta americana TaxID=6978 RepID=A0ABQ8T3D3_PERAM|nr:hypothetical protein ANN_08593 [Periplaneta americana]